MTIYVSQELEYCTTDNPQYYTPVVWINKVPFKLLTAELFAKLEKSAENFASGSIQHERFEEIRILMENK